MINSKEIRGSGRQPGNAKEVLHPVFWGRGRMNILAIACFAGTFVTQPVMAADWFDELPGSGSIATGNTSTTTQPTSTETPVYTTTTQPAPYAPVQVQERKERSVVAIALTQAVAGSLGGVLSDIIGTLGRKFIIWLNKPSPTPSSEMAANVANMSPSQVAAKSVEYPMLGIGGLVLLKDVSVDAQELGAIPLETVEGEPLDKWSRYKVNRRLTLKTNNIFAFNFTTNLPGLAKLYNVNARGETRLMSYYDALPFIDNRFPKIKGIRIHGEPGTEYLIIEFTPCIPASARHDDRITRYKGSLDFCKVEDIGQSGKSLNRSAKDMTDDGFESTNASAGTQGINVMGSLPDYRAGETVRLVIEVIHNAE